MKQKPLLFIFLVIFSFIACRKDTLETNAPHITNPTSYVLKKQVWAGPTTNGQSFLYKYNADHLVSTIERYQWGTYTVNGGPQQTWHDTAYYTFEYTNGLCSKWRMQEGSADGYFVLDYNSKKLPIKQTLYYTRSNAVQSYSFYTYNTSNNLVEQVDSTDKVNFRYVFTYNNNNNLTSVVNYILWSNPQQKTKSEWSTFDNKINFISAVNGLPITYKYGGYLSLSPNNHIDANYHYPVDINQPFDPPSYTSNSYQYNDEGLPTKLFSGPWTVTFEYEKFK